VDRKDSKTKVFRSLREVEETFFHQTPVKLAETSSVDSQALAGKLASETISEARKQFARGFPNIPEK